MIGDGTGTNADVWYINSTINANLTVNGGAGNDTITTAGAGNFIINAGAGNDTVYADNTGAQIAQAAVGAGPVITVDNQGTTSYTFNVTGLALANDGFGGEDTLQIGATTLYTAPAAGTLNNAAAILAVIDGNTYTIGGVNYVASILANTLILSTDDAAAAANLTYTTTNNAADVGYNAGAAAGAPQAAAGVDAEVFTVTYTDGAVGDTLTFDGVTVTLADTNGSGVVEATEVAAQVHAAADTNWTSADNADGSVTFTAAAAGATADVTDVIGGGTYTGTATAATAIEFNDGKATWVLNAANADINDLQSNALRTTDAVNVGLTVTFQGITTKLSEVADSYNAQKAVSITDLHVNQAIKAAIQADETLNKLIVAEDGPANTLIIKSLIDGVMDINDFAVTVSNITANGVVSEITTASLATQATAINAISGGASFATLTGTAATIATNFTDKLAQENGVNITGADSTAVSDNTITGGTGDDVIVLGTDATSNDKIVFSGSFGNDTIVNFETDAGVAAASDILDFTAYLVSAATAFTNGSANTAGGSVSIATEASVDGADANSTVDAAEVEALFEAAGTATIATNHIFITYDTDNIGSVWDVQNTSSGANDATATLVGTIHLAEDGTDLSGWASFAATDIA